jgi:integrase/recombinase XerD
LAVLLPEHLRALEASGYAASTVRARANQLGHLIRWLDARGVLHAADVTAPVLERYRLHLHQRRKRDGKPLSASAQAQVLIGIKGFFRWLAKQHHVRYSPAAELDLPRRPHRIPRTVLTAAEAERVLAQPDLAHPLGVRDRAVMELLYSTGVRRAECSGLDVTDLDLTRLVLLVREGKGARDRLVPLGERAAFWICRYLDDVRPLYATPPDSGALFLTKRGQRLDPKRLSGMVHGYIERADLGKEGSCHLFRHTMATLMLEGGADVRHIQEILGHAELSTTAIYTRVSIRQLQEVHRRTHPATLAPRKERHPSLGRRP